MLEDTGKNNGNNTNNKKKVILLVTDNIHNYQQQFNSYNINNYKITFVNWDDISTFTNTYDYTKSKNLELIILDLSIIAAEVAEDPKFNKLTTATITITTTIEEIKKIFFDKRIFFILPSQSIIEHFVSMKICKQEDIRVPPFSIFDLVDLISTTKKKERLYRIQLKDHTMHTYSSPDDKINDAIKFLKIGIKNNETTLILLDKNIQESYLKSMTLHHDININKLQHDGLLKIAYSEDWYLIFNQKKDNNNNNNENNKIVSIDGEKIHLKWNKLIEQSINSGRNGLRVFSMMDCFFEHGLYSELVDYECMASPKLNKPFLAFCAYNGEHIDKLSENQIKRLVLTHSNVWI